MFKYLTYYALKKFRKIIINFSTNVFFIFFFSSLSEISHKQQERALAASLADIIWTTGAMKKAIVCLITNESYFSESPNYKTDNFTEKVCIYIIQFDIKVVT